MLFSGMNTVPDANRTETWRQRYLASRYRQEYVDNRSGKQPATTDKTGEEKPRRQFGLGQWLALVKRNLIVRLQDRAQTAILLAQAPFFALLVAVIGHLEDQHNFGELAQKLPIDHFLMVVAAIWFGCNNAARDIVGEWTIYKRERMVTLKLLPYIFSKLAVLLALCIFQCGSMLAIVSLACGLRGNFLYDFIVLLLSSMIGAGLGLLISALSKTTESAIAMLPLVLLPIIALGGGMRAIYLMPKAGQVISAVIPSRWAFEANLLHETSDEQWGENKSIDSNCNLDQKQMIGPSPMPAGYGDNPSLNIHGQSTISTDLAENNFPAYLITFTDAQGKVHTCRAAADEQYPRTNPSAHAVANRHRFSDSVAVLCAMLLALVAGVIAILRKRDNDPQ
jgi:ABC-type multidrug transport system permease subunit